MLPHDFLKWENERYYYDIWSKPDENGISLLDRVLRKLVESEWEKCRGKGDDAGKKLGIKLHIGVDVLGLPQAIMLTTTEASDHSNAIEMVEYYCDVTDNLSLMKKVLLDGAYMGEPFADTIKSLSRVEVEVAKRSELHTFVVIPKHWLVERTFLA